MYYHEIRIEGFAPFRMAFDPSFYAEWVLLSYLSTNKVPEPELVDLIRRVVRPGDIVIDGGANIGFFSFLMSGLVGESGRVIAFEPAPPNIDRFKINRDLNRFINVALYTEALWSEIAKLDFWVNKDTGQSALWMSVDSIEKIQVRALPLDSISCALTAGVRLMKLDVEGAEERVLLGATSLLERGFPTFVVCELQPVALAQFDCHQDSLRSLMGKWGYQTFMLHEDGGLPALVPDRTVIKPDKRNVNVLFADMGDVQAAWPETST